METTVAIGKSILRKDALDKVTGNAKFNNDVIIPGILHAKMVTSLYALAKIKNIDVSQAMISKGVKAVITGENTDGILTGTFVEDRPILAVGKVRYFGEPVAVVIANSELEAKVGADLIKVEYEPIPVVNSPGEALKPNAPLVHENLDKYRLMKEVFPTPGTNVANHVKIRKGNMAKGWAESEIQVEQSFVLPQSDHAAIETRSVRAEIKPDGQVIVHSTSQAPYVIRKKINRHFKIDAGNIIVHTPFVGGAFGGKAAVQLELIAYLASKAVGGREVVLVNSREEDMISSPCRIGLEAKVKLGATKDGKVKAAEITYLVDSGAHSDIGAVITKSIASDCTGPYNFENVWCDSICTYTNHTYASSFGGFGHAEYTVAIEGTMDKLAKALKIDPLQLRLINAVKPGNTSPTQSELTESNIGKLSQCSEKIKTMINWDEGIKIDAGNNKIRAKGVSCFWKTSTTPPDAVSGAIVTFTPDGCANLNVGAVEFGQGTKTTLVQILAEKLKLDINRVHVSMEVNTQEYTYRISRAAAVLDVGKVINPGTAKGVIMGGMSMGLSLGSREAFIYNEQGIIQNPQLRTYKLLRSSEEPVFLVDFLETPEIDGPYGARGFGEHGTIGMPAALLNSLSTAAEADLDRLPLTPEIIWRIKTGREL